MKNPETIPCPICMKGLAINKSQAYMAFHSKTYAKRRKNQRKLGAHKKPQVGRMTTVEGALTNPEFGKLLSLPGRGQGKKSDKRYDEIETVCLWIFTFTLCVTGFTLVMKGYDRTLVELGSYLLGAMFIYLSIKFSFLLRIGKRLAERHVYYRTWLCLSCGSEWVEPEVEK